MEIRLLFVGRTETGHVREALDHYLTRIQRGMKVSETVVRESRRTDVPGRCREEGEAILKALDERDVVVLLDERGATMGSEAFARHLGQWRDQGARRITFVVGGAYGLDDAVRRRARHVISLSPMTFPHQLVRVILAEQLYRALSILKGTPYHH